jgi:hypothetical protein
MPRARARLPGGRSGCGTSAQGGPAARRPSPCVVASGPSRAGGGRPGGCARPAAACWSAWGACRHCRARASAARCPRSCRRGKPSGLLRPSSPGAARGSRALARSLTRDTPPVPQVASRWSTTACHGATGRASAPSSSRREPVGPSCTTNSMRAKQGAATVPRRSRLSPAAPLAWSQAAAVSPIAAAHVCLTPRQAVGAPPPASQDADARQTRCACPCLHRACGRRERAWRPPAVVTNAGRLRLPLTRPPGGGGGAPSPAADDTPSFWQTQSAGPVVARLVWRGHKGCGKSAGFCPTISCRSVLSRGAELLLACSSSDDMTDTKLSRFTWICDTRSQG